MFFVWVFVVSMIVNGYSIFMNLFGEIMSAEIAFKVVENQNISELGMLMRKPGGTFFNKGGRS